MSDTLARITADKRRLVESRKAGRPLSEVETAARKSSPPRGFADRLARTVAAGGYGLIA